MGNVGTSERIQTITDWRADWKPGDPIGYIRPEIPDFEMPSYTGERYEAMVPDTLDLAERARLAINALTENPDPLADYEVNGADRRLGWGGRYDQVGDVKPGDTVAVTFPIAEETVESVCSIRVARDRFSPWRMGGYLLQYHNNDGSASGGPQPMHSRPYGFARRSMFIAVGKYRPNAHQPIWFSPGKRIADTDGVSAGVQSRLDCGTYSSLTEKDGKRVLWYPDRKHFLLGKLIPDELLADMTVPEVRGSDNGGS